MTTTESTHEQIKSLIRLQYIDNRIFQVEKLRGDLPEDIRDLEDERTGLETRIERFQSDAEDNKAHRLEAERIIVESEAAIERYEKQQLQVRNNREYDALTKEIEAHRDRIADAQNGLLEAETTDTEHQNLVEEAQKRHDELNTIIAEKQKELESLIEDTESERELLNTRKQEIKSQIDKRYLNAYRRLRDRLRDGRAVVPLIRGAAGGYAVPPQQQVEIRQRNRIVICEHTGRIIVDEELYRESIAQLEANL
jgi:predicted  nucleic acid-binding Zn-ribbon protein